MKRLFSLFLVVLVIAFLAITNPTLDEYARWYTEQSLPDRDGAMDELLAQFTEHMASTAVRKDYLVCSVFSHNDGSKTLGVALIFIPLDDAIAQADDLRETYSTWLEEINTQR